MRRWCWVVVVILAVIGVLYPRPGQAIPAFARREAFSCQVCHFRMPELNATGQEYLRRGMRMPGVETPAPRALGEPLPFKVENWASVMGEHNVTFAKGAEAEFNAGGIDAWIAGPLNPRWSALVNASADIDNGGSEVELGYAHFITANSDRVGSVRFGQVLPLAIQFNQGGPSMPLSTPVVLETPADTGNPWTPATNIRALEVGLVNMANWAGYFGVGQPHLEDFEGERHTDLYASLSSRLPSQPLTLTGYGYWGKASFDTLLGEEEESFHRLGIFAQWIAPETLANFGFLSGSDDLPGGGSLDNRGWFLLGEQLLSDRWAAYLRYDHVRRDLAAGGEQTIKGPAFGATWWLQTELRLGAEVQLLHVTGEESDRTLILDAMWIF